MADDAHDMMDDPRDFRKRITDEITNAKYEVGLIHEKVEKGDRSLIYQHDFRLAYLLGLTTALRMFDAYQEELQDVLKAMSEQQGQEPESPSE